MNDRELLEKAAAATTYGSIETWEEKVGRDVNPIENDGDAFRLMVELGMNICCYANVIVVTTTDDVDTEEVTGGDLAAATRRAIVRAAAAMADS